MIFLVSKQKEFLDFSADIKLISVEESLELLNKCTELQYDSETIGLDPHIGKLLCIQFGSKAFDFQIIVDVATVDILRYKEVLETKLLIGHNLKFDLQFLYNYEIIPTKLWDTMIIDQLLHLGFDSKYIKYNLKEVALRYLGVDLDKSIRSEINTRGLDYSVIKYSANDVVYLEDIRNRQIKLCNYCKTGVQLENNFVTVMAYLEWCGIRLDQDKWKKKMENDLKNLEESEQKLNKILLNRWKKDNFYTPYIELDLFEGERVALNWSSSTQLKPIFKHMGFNILVEDPKTHKIKESIVEKLIKIQKGIDDEFLNAYLERQQYAKVCTTYGQNYLDAINPITDRINTTFKQLGATSGRMSCGDSKHNNEALAKLKKIPANRCKYVQLQNLPADDVTRSSFIAKEGNLMCSCDYSALELVNLSIH